MSIECVDQQMIRSSSEKDVSGKEQYLALASNHIHDMYYKKEHGMISYMDPSDRKKCTFMLDCENFFIVLSLALQLAPTSG